jgi:PAS domain S-box-containing protein
VFLTAVVISVLFVLILLDARITADDLNALQEHYISHLLLRGYMFSATRMLDYYIMFAKLSQLADDWLADQMAPKVKPQIYPMHFYELELLLTDATASTQGAMAMLKELSLGDERWGPAIGISSQADAVRFSDQCKINITPGNSASYFHCLSLERIFGYWSELQTSLQYHSDAIDPASADVESLAVLMMSRIPLGFDKVLYGFSQAFREKINNFKFLLEILLVGSIICLILFYAMEIFVVSSISEAFITFRSLLLRVNPVTFVATQPMISLVCGSREVDSRVTSAAHAVFQTSQDALISLNQEGIIESLNPSATTIFGYTPEQMLGQSLRMLVNPEFEGNGGLFTTANLMKTGQSGLVYVANVSGTKDDGTQVPLHLTLLGFSSNGRLAESFAVMCKDQTEEVSQKNAVEEAKKQSENLLMQILPRDIIMRLNRGDKNISFTVPSATIVFMDIEKFSNYSANLSAAQLMQNLGLVFTSYDSLLPKFPLITKIKLIGDDYMAAAGLFNPDKDPAAHAHQVVQFALECLTGLEDLHQQLNASLQVRVGVNTNGPLIAGVLGTDKPLFDIIGDPINVAARLQSTDIPGLVQISEATYKLIADGPYHIDQRGEIDLKGKGKQMTYLVHPKDRS